MEMSQESCSKLPQTRVRSAHRNFNNWEPHEDCILNPKLPFDQKNSDVFTMDRDETIAIQSQFTNTFYLAGKWKWWVLYIRPPLGRLKDYLIAEIHQKLVESYSTRLIPALWIPSFSTF